MDSMPLRRYRHGVAVIWERTIDEAAIARRHQRFFRYYVFPALGLLLVMSMLGQWGALLGLSIVLTLFGLLLGAWVFLTSINERSNRELVVEGKVLRLSKREVLLDQVVRFTTYESSESFTTADATSQIAVAKVEFDVRAALPDGTQKSHSVEFCWPEMEAKGLEGVRSALETVLPGKWVTLNTFRQPLP